MGIPNNIIEDFFAEYERRTNQGLTDDPVVDVEATAGAFTDCFIESSPKGVMCGTNDAKFREQIPKGFEFYRSIGTKSMQIQSVSITVIDETHSMAKVLWRAHYIKKDSSELDLDFEVIYFVKSEGDKLKIFCHVTGDEEKAYKDNGIVPINDDLSLQDYEEDDEV